MDLTIRKILSIDSETEEYKKNLELNIMNKKKELHEYIQAMEKEYSDETEKIISEIVEVKIFEARKVAQEIKSSGNLEIQKLNNLFKVQKNSILNEAFIYIINSFKVS